MNKLIKYLNLFGDEITVEQKNKLNKYQIGYFSNDEIERRELYENSELISTTYHIGNPDKIVPIIEQDYNASFELLYNDNGYEVCEVITYRNKLLVNKRVYVSNKNDDLICMRDYILNPEGIPIGNSTEKYYSEKGENRYIFEYSKDGTCFMIHDEKYDQNDIFGRDIGDTSKTDFSWDNFKYYQFSDPLIPNEGQ